MNPFPRLAVLLALAVGCLPAQDPGALKKIVDKVDQELQAIDQLLQQSAKRSTAERKPQAMLQETQDRSKAVESGIDELIEQLRQMQQKSQSQSQQQDQQQQDQQQQQQQQQEQQRRNQQRRDGQTPDFVQQEPRQQGQQEQQGQQQQGQQPQPGQQQPQPQGQQPEGGQETPDSGRNQPGNRQPEPQTGPGQPGTGEASWGELQPYFNALKNKGSQPKVPEKYRKYWEAYLKGRKAPGR